MLLNNKKALITGIARRIIAYGIAKNLVKMELNYVLHIKMII